MWIVRLALRRPYTFVVLALLIGVLGVFSIVTMSVDIFPSINIPVVTVIGHIPASLPARWRAGVSAYRTSQASVAAATATVASNEANLRRLQELISFERVVAPFDGVVIQRSIDAGALITAGSPVNNTA